jgi:hypothetical protein
MPACRARSPRSLFAAAHCGCSLSHRWPPT